MVAGKNELRYSTPEMLAIEGQVIEGALARQSEGAGLATPEALATVLAKEFELSEEQKEMLARLATSGHGVEVIAAPAGTGETTAFAAAREIWERSGRNVSGCVLSARAAQELQAKSGIESYTIDSLLIDLQHPRYGGLLRGSVLVVDEAGMVDTRKLEPQGPAPHGRGRQAGRGDRGRGAGLRGRRPGDDYLWSIEDKLEKTTRGLNQVSAELAERPTDPDLADREAYLRPSMEYLAAEREKLHHRVRDHQRWVDSIPPAKSQTMASAPDSFSDFRNGPIGACRY